MRTSLVFFASLPPPPIQFQHVPPANHRANPSERAIKTYKSHLISTLASTHIFFPPDRCDLLLPHAKLTLNHFRSFSLDPSIFAWDGLQRVIHDFSVSVTNAQTQRSRELWTEIRDRSVKEKEGREIPTIFSSPFV